MTKLRDRDIDRDALFALICQAVYHQYRSFEVQWEIDDLCGQDLTGLDRGLREFIGDMGGCGEVCVTMPGNKEAVLANFFKEFGDLEEEAEVDEETLLDELFKECGDVEEEEPDSCT